MKSITYRPLHMVNTCFWKTCEKHYLQTTSERGGGSAVLNKNVKSIVCRQLQSGTANPQFQKNMWKTLSADHFRAEPEFSRSEKNMSKALSTDRFRAGRESCCPRKSCEKHCLQTTSERNRKSAALQKHVKSITYRPFQNVTGIVLPSKNM